VGSERSHCWWFRVAFEALDMGWIAKDMSYSEDLNDALMGPYSQSIYMSMIRTWTGK
jgi:hypothetical protein